MTKKMLITFMAAALTTNAFAQPDTLWTRTYGGGYYDGGSSVRQTTDGGFIIAGHVNGPFMPDTWLIKTDSNGDTLWTRTYGEWSYASGANSVQQTTDGGYIITGSTYGGIPGTAAVLLFKTDANGDILWSETFSGNYGSSVQQTTDGGYIITGLAGFYMVWPDGHLYLTKTDSSGDILWTRAFSGYRSWDGGASVQQTSDGGYIATGYKILEGSQSSYVWLVKTDSNGDSLWTRTFGGGDGDEGECVQQTLDGGYIVAGYTQSYGAGGKDVWLIKTDSNGDSLWTRTFGGAEDDKAYSVRQTIDGGYIVAGSTQSYGAGSNDVWLIKTDSNGDSLWSCTVGGVSDDEGYCVELATDGGYIITGSTFSYGAGGPDVWLIRLETEIPVLHLTLLNPPIQIPAAGGSFDFDFEINNATSTSWVVDVSTEVTLPGGTAYPLLTRNGIVLDPGTSLMRTLTQYVPAGTPSGNYTYHGYLFNHNTWELLSQDSFPFEKLPGDDAPEHDCGWALFGWEEDGVESAVLPSGSSLLGASPNPFNPFTTISYQLSTNGHINLAVYDLQGRFIDELVNGWRDAGVHEVTFDAVSLASGVYFYRIEAGEFTAVNKMVLMK